MVIGKRQNIPPLAADCILTGYWSDLMDSAAEVLSSLPKDYHHVFDLVHFILAIQGERQDMGDG